MVKKDRNKPRRAAAPIAGYLFRIQGDCILRSQRYLRLSGGEREGWPLAGQP